MRTVEFHDEAAEELIAATDWYAERNLSAAVGFAEEIRAAVASIASDPLRFPSLGPEQYFYLLKRFPYLLVFRVTNHHIRILAVAHASRRPGYWIARD